MSADIKVSLRGPQAYDFARQAIEAMETHHVWPTVLNFEIWVNYVAQRSAPLAIEIDRLLAAGEPFTESLGEALAAQFLPETRRTGDVLDAGNALTRELKTVSKAIATAQKSSEVYGQTLADASVELKEDDANKVKAVVETLTAATRQVQHENRTLESQLAETNAELGRLRDSLEQVRRDAMTDGLTNLANRKAFDEALEDACNKADRGGGPVCLGILDIDHFKRFNDTWGHQIGDQVLRYVSSVIGRAGAPPRFAARYGGEEFAVIFPNDDPATAMGVMEEIRQEVSSRSLKRRSTNEDLGAITVSAGLAERIAGEPGVSLVERADTALYASKHAGRNRTTQADPPPHVSAAA